MNDENKRDETTEVLEDEYARDSAHIMQLLLQLNEMAYARHETPRARWGTD